MRMMGSYLITPKVRNALSTLEGFVGLSGVVAGVGIALSVIQLPADRLEDTPFTSFTIPGLLLVGVGAICLIAIAALWCGDGDGAPFLSVLCAAMLGGWTVVEVTLLGPATWLESLYCVLVGGIAALTLRLVCLDDDGSSIGAGCPG
jgi:hypothetical protein